MVFNPSQNWITDPSTTSPAAPASCDGLLMFSSVFLLEAANRRCPQQIDISPGMPQAQSPDTVTIHPPFDSPKVPAIFQHRSSLVFDGRLPYRSADPCTAVCHLGDSLWSARCEQNGQLGHSDPTTLSCGAPGFVPGFRARLWPISRTSMSSREDFDVCEFDERTFRGQVSRCGLVPRGSNAVHSFCRADAPQRGFLLSPGSGSGRLNTPVSGPQNRHRFSCLQTHHQPR